MDMAKLHHHLRNAFIPHAGNDYQPHALRRNALHWYTAIIATVKIAVVFFVAVYATQAQLSNITTQTIVSLTNQARQQNKVTALKSNTQLVKAAQLKANDMAAQHYFAHVSPSGVTPWTWIKKAGYTYTLAGENLAIDFAQSEDIIQAWLASPSHRKNLLNGKFQDIGVAVGTAKIDGLDSLVVVQMFGTPVAVTTVTKPAPTAKPIVKPTLVVTQPPQKVLGETAPVVQYTQPPVITSPTPGMIISGRPTVTGTTYPGAEVTLLVGNEAVAKATAGADGVYRLEPADSLPDGVATIHVTASVRNQSSVSSQVLDLTVDASPPAINAEQSFVIPSYVVEHAYDISVAVDGQPTSVVVRFGGQEVPLMLSNGRYVATVKAPNDGTIGGVVTVVMTDGVGNSSITTLNDPEPFTTGVTSSKGGPIVAALKLIFFSRAFLMTFIALMLVMATMNIVIERRHQHHPTIIGSLLVMYLAGTLLFM